MSLYQKRSGAPRSLGPEKLVAGAFLIQHQDISVGNNETRHGRSGNGKADNFRKAELYRPM